MSSVFNTSNLIRTKTGIPNAGVDNHIDISGSAGNWGEKRGIIGRAFLSGPTPGEEQALVKGTQTAHITGDRQVKILGHLTTNIITGEDHSVLQGRITTVTPNDSLNINGERVITVTGSNMRTILGPYLSTHVGPKTRNEVSSWFEWEGVSKLKVGINKTGLYALKAEVVGVKMDVEVVKMVSALMKNEVFLNHLRAATLTAWLGVARLRTELLANT